jgi:hypothetical protein
MGQNVLKFGKNVVSFSRALTNPTTLHPAGGHSWTDLTDWSRDGLPQSVITTYEMTVNRISKIQIVPKINKFWTTVIRLEVKDRREDTLRIRNDEGEFHDQGDNLKN